MRTIGPTHAPRHGAFRRTPRSALRVVLAAAVLVPLATAGVAAWSSWRDAWREAREETGRAADTVAEYARRIFDAQRLTAERADDLIRGLSDDEIRAREEELHEAFRDLVRDMETARIILVTGRDGTVLATSHAYPVPPVSGADREWAVALRDPATPEPHVSAVHVSRLDGRMFLALTIRRGHARARRDPPRSFEGLVQITSTPDDIASGMASLLERPEDVTTLVRADGHMLANLPPFAQPPPQFGEASAFRRVVASGRERALFVTESTLTGISTLYAQRRAGSYPVYAAVGRRVSEIHAAWLRRFAGHLAWIGPATLCLLGAALYARRHVHAAEAAEAALREESTRRAIAEAREAAEARFRAIFDTDVMGMVIFEPATGATYAINDRLLAMKGRTRAEFEDGRAGWGDSTPPEYHAADEKARGQAIARGSWEPYEKEYLRPDGTRLPVRLFSAPLPDEPGLVVVLVEDISRQRAAERRRDLLVREVQHRAQNVFAVLRAVVRMSRAGSAEDLAEALDGRIQALARATALLTRGVGEGTALRALAEAALAPFLHGGSEEGGARVTLQGDRVRLDSAVAQPVAMMLHELATNAMKYGALSRPGGRVTLTWDSAGGRLLTLRWEESGGPPPAAPRENGFGFQLMDSLAAGQFGGGVARDWDAAGLRCTITLPLEEEDHFSIPSPSPGTAACSPSVSRT